MTKQNTFTENNDGYGKSYCCDVCGKNQFYVGKPSECDHNPKNYEVEMHKGRTARAEDNLRGE